MDNKFEIDEINAQLDALRNEEIDAYIASLDVNMIADLEVYYADVR